jgi:hypothetical protein
MGYLYCFMCYLKWDYGNGAIPIKKRDFRNTDEKILNCFCFCSRNIPSRFCPVPIFSHRYESVPGKN